MAVQLTQLMQLMQLAVVATMVFGARLLSKDWVVQQIMDKSFKFGYGKFRLRKSN